MAVGSPDNITVEEEMLADGSKPARYFRHNKASA